MLMQCSCRQDLLNAALGHAARAVSARAAAEMLKGILLECGGESLTVTGNDLELGIVAVLPAEVQTPGSCVLDARMISEIVRRAPGDEILISVNDRYIANIRCGASEFDVTALPSENYPVLPEVTGLRSLTVPQAELKKLLNMTLFSVSDAETKHIHTGVLFDAEPETLTLVALDGHRLSLSKVPHSGKDTFSAVLPANSLRELERMLTGDEDANAAMHIGARHVLVDLDGLTLVTRVMEGDFFKYKTGIPKTNNFRAVLEVKPLIRTLERVGLLITEKLKNPVRLLFSEGKLTVSCQTAMGRAQDDIPCEEGGDLEIGFNHRYLLDALRHMEGERFRFETGGPVSPCLLTAESDEDTLFMVLPVRLSAAL
ncbi:MAG: DNA polymerase III subunit beta [Oscillospiraceae bacterium]|jgi:DNA polymerase-3 subunit beta|nr:DNA polymerase III subunit beta [Oscillospiraceae bacterium]